MFLHASPYLAFRPRHGTDADSFSTFFLPPCCQQRPEGWVVVFLHASPVFIEIPPHVTAADSFLTGLTFFLPPCCQQCVSPSVTALLHEFPFSVKPAHVLRTVETCRCRAHSMPLFRFARAEGSQAIAVENSSEFAGLMRPSSAPRTLRWSIAGTASPCASRSSITERRCSWRIAASSMALFDG